VGRTTDHVVHTSLSTSSFVSLAESCRKLRAAPNIRDLVVTSMQG
jgi:hypothetical protein